MRLSSQSSQFVYNFPSTFVPDEIAQRYEPLLRKNHIQYETVIDYLNSTIKSVTFPGLSINMPNQRLIRGKQRDYKPSMNVQDIKTNRSITVNFRSVDSDLNYLIMQDLFYYHYLDVDNLYAVDFEMVALDIWWDAIYSVVYKEIILTALSENTFDHSSFRVNPKEFSLDINYNFSEINYLLDQSQILENVIVPRIITP